MPEVQFADAASAIIALGLWSLIFFSTVLIVFALLFRGRWEHLGESDDQHRKR